MLCIICNDDFEWILADDSQVCKHCAYTPTMQVLRTFDNAFQISLKPQSQLYGHKVSATQWVARLIYLLQHWPDPSWTTNLPDTIEHLHEHMVQHLYIIGQQLTNITRSLVLKEMQTHVYWATLLFEVQTKKIKTNPIMPFVINEIRFILGAYHNGTDEQRYLLIVKNWEILREALQVYKQTFTITTCLPTSIQELIYEYAPMCSCECTFLAKNLTSLHFGCDYSACTHHLSCSCCIFNTDVFCNNKKILPRCNQCVKKCSACLNDMCHACCSDECTVCGNEVCSLCSNKCEDCFENIICVTCSVEYKCDVCKSPVCDTCTSHTCSKCLKQQKLCTKCQYKCKSCENCDLCATCFITNQCLKCKAAVCDMCVPDSCSECKSSDIICTKCEPTEQCGLCNRFSCDAHSYANRCSICFVSMCYEHIQHRNCVICNVTFKICFDDVCTTNVHCEKCLMLINNGAMREDKKRKLN